MKKNISIEELKKRPNSKIGMRKQTVVPLPVASLDSDTKENIELLEECRRWWESMRDLRTRTRRNRKYYRGDQWSDEMQDPTTGRWITEETHLMNQGKVPLKQNRIRNLVANLIGQFRSNPTKAVVIARGREEASLGEMLTNTLQCALELNEVKELDARELEVFLMSGVACQKIGYDFWKERNLEDLTVENTNINRLFLNTDVSDIRLKDLRLIGEIIDTTVDNIVSAFAKNTAQEQRIRELYANMTAREFFSDYGFDARRTDHLDFYIPRDTNKARIFEVWQLKSEWRTYVHDPTDGSYTITKASLKEIAAENDMRLEMGLQNGINKLEVPLLEAEAKLEQFWYVKYLTPSGHCLYERESPYKHEEHPYSLVLFPLLDGEVWGFVEDMIDQQRYVNRMVIMLDFIIGASAKGVLMVPADCVPDDMTPEEFADEYRRFNGVIFYKPRADGQVPKQIAAASVPAGIMEMLNLQMTLLERNSGINESIQGQRAPSGTPAALYAQEAQNATLNVVDQLQTFQSMILRRNRKALKVITQFYKDKRYLAINGRAATQEEKIYDPNLVQDLDWDMTIAQGMDTPVYRQLVDDMLFELLKGKLIDLEMYLEHTSMPFADKLLATVRTRMESLASGGAPGGIPPEIAAQAGGADPRAMAMLQQAVGMGGGQTRPAA